VWQRDNATGLGLLASRLLVGAPTHQSPKEAAAPDEQSAQDGPKRRGEGRQRDHTREHEAEHPPERRPESLGRSDPPEPLTESRSSDDEQDAANEAPNEEAAASETMTHHGAECSSHTAEHAHREEQQGELHANKLVCPGPRGAPHLALPACASPSPEHGVE
jgi:hypothetical protein